MVIWFVRVSRVLIIEKLNTVKSSQNAEYLDTGCSIYPKHGIPVDGKSASRAHGPEGRMINITRKIPVQKVTP